MTSAIWTPTPFIIMHDDVRTQTTIPLKTTADTENKV